MNKAFLKEPEPGEPRCPLPDGCDGLGVAVPGDAVAVHLRSDLRTRLAGVVYYCDAPDCGVAYFDRLGESIPAAELSVRAYPKHPGGPLCGCLDVGAEELIEAAGRGSRELIQRLVKHAASGAARCTATMPAGTSCEENARRLFLRHFPGP